MLAGSFAANLRCKMTIVLSPHYNASKSCTSELYEDEHGVTGGLRCEIRPRNVESDMDPPGQYRADRA